jgi:MFS family permease
MPADRLLTRPFVLVSAANMANGLSFNLFLHLPGYLTDLGASEVEIGLIIGVAAIASILIRPIVGMVMDTRGRRSVIIAGNVLSAIAVLLYLTVDAIGPWVYAVRVIHGLSEAILFSALFTYGADVVPPSRLTEGLALFGTSGLLPIALGGLIGDVVLGFSGFRLLFLVALGFAVLSLVLSLPLPEPQLDGGGPRRRGFLSAVLQANLAPLWWMTGVFAFSLTAYFTFLKTFVDEAGIGSLGLFFSTYVAMAIGVRLTLAWLPERIGEERVMFPSISLLVGGLVVLSVAGSAAHIAIAGLMCGVGHGFGFPILYGFVIRRAVVRDRGSAVAIFTSLFDVGTLVGGPILGAVIAMAGYPAMFLVAAAAMTCGLGVFAVWDRGVVARESSILERPVPAHHL